jgi:hypothetical protein
MGVLLRFSADMAESAENKKRFFCILFPFSAVFSVILSAVDSSVGVKDTSPHLRNGVIALLKSSRGIGLKQCLKIPPKPPLEKGGTSRLSCSPPFLKEGLGEDFLPTGHAVKS